MSSRHDSRSTGFFFAEEVPYGLALVRITLPLVLLIGVIHRWPHVREIFSADGAPTPLWLSYGTPAFLPELPAPVAVACYAILTMTLVTASLGWMTRLSLATAMLLYGYFGVMDQVSTLTKYTVIACHLLLLLACSDCGALWSVDAWRRQQAHGSRRGLALVRRSAVWPQRLLQLFIGIVYLGAAFTKMHTPAFFSGDQLIFWMLSNITLDNPLGEWLTLYPAMLVVVAYVTIVWEILFPFLVWYAPWRGVLLAIGVLFHAMTYFSLGLVLFPLIYFSAYLGFLEPRDVEWLLVAGRRLGRRSHRQRRLELPTAVPSTVNAWLSGRRWQPAFSGAAFCLVMTVCVVLAVELEHRSDVYRLRSPAGRLPLKQLDEQTVARMLGPEQRIRPQDLYFAFDVGTTRVGGLLADRKETFEMGETAIVECTLQPPHPDMWIEVNLHDAENRVLKRIGKIVPREELRADFFYPLTEPLAPGSYEFVLRYDGLDVSRRRITLVGTQQPLTAMR
jgi:hypothetical protein